MESTNYQTFLGMSMDSASTIATALMLILLLPRLIVQRYSVKALIGNALVLFIGLIVFFITRSWICLCLGLFVCAGRKIRIDPLMWIMLINAVTVFLLTYGGARLGVIDTYVTSRMGETRMRNSLGFAQVNSVGFIGARIGTAIVVLRRDKRPWFGVAVCFLLALFIEVVANSRTSEFYLLVLTVVPIALWRRMKSKTLSMPRVSKSCVALLVAFVAITFYMIGFFNPANTVEMEISRLLSNRLYSMWYIAHTHPLTLLGSAQAVYTMESIWTGDSYAILTVDNGWASWLIRYGLIPTSILLTGLIALFRKAKDANATTAYPITALALMCSLFAFCESSALAIDANPLLVLLACVVYGDSVETMTRGKK